MKAAWLHHSLDFFYRAERQRYEQSLGRLESTQLMQLKSILAALPNSKKPMSYAEFSKNYSSTQYSDWQRQIEEQKRTGREIVAREVIRYEPTSGSTFERKWVPYSRKFLQEMNAAVAAWVGDLYRLYPEIKEGSHFWSMSWLPEDLRQQATSDDTEIFPWWQRIFIQKMMTLPSGIGYVPSMEASWFATLCYGVADQDLSMISVWSPTFLLKALNDIDNQWGEIQMTLASGTWARHADQLKTIRTPRRALSQARPPYDILWPRLSLLSCWKSSTSKEFADRLSEKLPAVPQQGKGLWATEGVVTIPFQGQYPLACRSHFYEFRCLDSLRILPCWQLRTGQLVQPLITAGNGLVRYELQDQMRVTGFLGNTPCFEFLSRIASVDLVGEKMSHDSALQILKSLREKFSGEFFTLIGVKSPEPRYVLLCRGENLETESLERWIESQLLQFHHYRLARELGQLQNAQIKTVTSQQEIERLIFQSQIQGQNKVEPLLLRESLR